MNKFLISLEEGADKASISVAMIRKQMKLGRLTEPVLVRVGRRTMLNPDLFYYWLTEDPETFARTISRYLGKQPGNSARNLHSEKLKKEPGSVA